MPRDMLCNNFGYFSKSRNNAIENLCMNLILLCIFNVITLTTAMLTHKFPLPWISLHVSFISFSCVMSIYVNILCTNHVDVTVITAFNLTVYTYF